MKKTLSFALLVLLLLGFSQLSFGRDVVLTWGAPNPSTGVTGYKIYRGTTSGGPYTFVAQVTGVGTLTYTQQHVPAGTFYYVGRSVDASGNESVDSTQAIAVVPSNCDINVDGAVNVLDYQLLSNIVLNKAVCPAGKSCDVTRDGTVNVIDVQTVSNVVLNKITCPF